MPAFTYVQALLFYRGRYLQHRFDFFQVMASTRIEYRLIVLDNEQQLRFSRLGLWVAVLYLVIIFGFILGFISFKFLIRSQWIAMGST